jgi:hypothetical protein
MFNPGSKSGYEPTGRFTPGSQSGYEPKSETAPLASRENTPRATSPYGPPLTGRFNPGFESRSELKSKRTWSKPGSVNVTQVLKSILQAVQWRFIASGRLQSLRSWSFGKFQHKTWLIKVT